MKPKPEIERLNALVQEFDWTTNYNFDRVTDVISLAKLAESWPGSRIGLADDLRAAHLSLAMHEAFKPWLPVWKPYL